MSNNISHELNGYKGIRAIWFMVSHEKTVLTS